jgi:ankyrin repeat protein
MRLSSIYHLHGNLNYALTLCSHHAARGEHLDVVKLLLEAGASPKKENTYGQTPADMADQDTEVRTLLLAKQVEASTHMSDD